MSLGHQVRGFTHTSHSGLVREIILPCGVSAPFHPTINKGQKQPEIIQTRALWDTGATCSVITDEIAKKIGLSPTGKIQSHHAGGTSTVSTYMVNIYLHNKVCISNVRVTECIDTIGRFGILIGMDIITQGDFAVSNHNGNTTVSFRMPSIGRIDLAKDGISPDSGFIEKNERRIIQPKISRNSPCHCGSGKKYKHCHGA